MTDGEDVRDWLYSLDSARLCPLMSNAGYPHERLPSPVTGDGVVLPKEGFATTQYNNVPLLMLTGSTEFSMVCSVGCILWQRRNESILGSRD